MSDWKKSTYSGNNACVQVARTANGDVWVRDSKNPNSPILQFHPHEWQAFVAGVKDNEFDY